MAGEAIVLNMKSGVYFGMEQVAALIWNLVEKPRTVGEIRDAIMKEYEVDSNTCEQDRKSFLRSLRGSVQRGPARRRFSSCSADFTIRQKGRSRLTELTCESFL